MTWKSLLTFAAAAALVSLACAANAPAVQAQAPTPDFDDGSCVACHENLYYLYDTGKWHCLCDATPSCVHCHGGQPGVLEEDLAHAGMIVNPLQNDAAICQQCHCDDCQEHVDEFLAVAGLLSRRSGRWTWALR